jgi:hypothetical protein
MVLCKDLLILAVKGWRLVFRNLKSLGSFAPIEFSYLKLEQRF